MKGFSQDYDENNCQRALVILQLQLHKEYKYTSLNYEFGAYELGGKVNLCKTHFLLTFSFGPLNILF